MPIPSYFNDFLKNIRLTSNQIDDLKTGHKTLRNRLAADPELSKIIVSTFLQGSYRRSTAIRPNNGKRADVDIIVVTTIDRHGTSPKEVIEKFKPFVDKYYKDKYRIQGRSIGIELSYVDLDIVITSAPSQAQQSRLRSASVTTNLTLEDDREWKLVEDWVEPQLGAARSQFLLESIRKQADWKSEPLWIPDREANQWVETDPLEQIRWTREKNKSTNLHYVNVVKAIKWWRVSKLIDLKYPKGYPVEHMIGDCCPDHITSVAQGITETLENIVSHYAWNRSIGIVPDLRDRGVQSHDVWKRVSVEDFNAFYDYVKEAAGIARQALDASTVHEKVKYWKLLFGKAFPDAPPPSVKGGFSERNEPTQPSGGRFS